ncbi:tetratricopeptide repeat protein [Candidatus Neomarinimicrobiota bacterium]
MIINTHKLIAFLLAGIAGTLSPITVFAQQDVSLESRIAQLQQEVQADPRNPDLHFELSKLYEQDVEKYYDQALSEFGLAVDNGLKGSQKPFVWNEVAMGVNDSGMLLYQSGQYDEALVLLESARKLNPKNPNIYMNIGASYFMKGEHDKGVEYIRKAVDLDPVSIIFNQSLGYIQLEQGDLKGALLSLNKIDFLDPNNKTEYWGIGRAHQGLGEYDKAIDAYKTYLTVDKGNKEVKALIKECKRLR